MADEIKPADAPVDAPAEETKETEEKKEAEEPKVDMFGESDTPPANPNKKSDTKKEGEGDGGDGKDKKTDTIPDDHPAIVALTKKIEDVKKEYGSNLSGQRSVIEKLEDEIKVLKKGEGDDKDIDVPFKDIKHSKDLSKEDKEKMSDTELKQMDQIADMQELANKNHITAVKGTKTQTDEKVSNLNTSVQAEAKALATKEDGTVNTELANQIIESSKQFKLEGLTAEQLKEKIKVAAGLVPDYKPAKEQKNTNKTNKTVKDNKKGDDPFGSNKIIEEATAESDGKYGL